MTARTLDGALTILSAALIGLALLGGGVASAQGGPAPPDCEIIDALDLEDTTLYACADGRYLQIEVDAESRPRVRASGQVPAAFRRFVRVGDGVELELVERVPLRLTEREGRVRAVEGRRASIEGGRFASGERVALVETRGGAQHVAAVGRVVSGDDEAVVVEVGMGEVVPLGSSAVRTELAPTADPWAPPRFGNIWQVTLGARPFLSLSEGAQGGFAGSFALRYRAKGPLVVTADIDPLSLSPRAFGGIAVTSVMFTMVGFDLPMVEVSAGVGTSTNERDCCGSWAFVLAQRVRLGALDGLHLEATMVEGFSSGPLLHSLSVRAQVPLEPAGVRDVWLVARGAGGAAGYGLGEVGVRTLLVGNGWRRSFYLTVLAGGISTSWRTFGLQVDHLGPLLGLEIEGRF